MVRHDKTGKCPKCQEIFNRYSGFNKELRDWFEAFQSQNPEAHISCAGRDAADQEAALKNGATRAKWTQSAHNWNCAIDVFVIDPVRFGPNLYPKEWFRNTLAPAIPAWLNWYGAPGSSFYEMAHIELREWKTAKLALVSDADGKKEV